MRGACRTVAAMVVTGWVLVPAGTQSMEREILTKDGVFVLEVEGSPPNAGVMPAVWVDPFLEVVVRRGDHKVVVRSASGVPWNGNGRWTRVEERAGQEEARTLDAAEAGAVLAAALAIPTPQWRVRPNRRPGDSPGTGALEVRVGGTSTAVALPSTDRAVLELLRLLGAED